MPGDVLRLGARARVDAELTEMVKDALCRALAAGASELRFEPRGRDLVGIRIRQRVGGVLVEQAAPPPASFAPSMLACARDLLCGSRPRGRVRKVLYEGQRVLARSSTLRIARTEYVVVRFQRRAPGAKRRPPRPQREAPMRLRKRADLRPCYLPVPAEPLPLPTVPGSRFTSEGLAASLSAAAAFVSSSLAWLLLNAL